MARKVKDRLTPLRQRFVEQYLVGPEGVRLHATAAYQAAGGKATHASALASAASQILNNLKVQRAMQALQRAADAQIITRLVDWKVAAVAAQPWLIALSKGLLPDGRRMVDRDDAAVGQVILGSLKEIIDRGFPKNLKVTIDPREALLALIGRGAETLPDPPVMDEDA
jgi:hypothetical protein